MAGLNIDKKLYKTGFSGFGNTNVNGLPVSIPANYSDPALNYRPWFNPPKVVETTSPQEQSVKAESAPTIQATAKLPRNSSRGLRAIRGGKSRAATAAAGAAAPALPGTTIQPVVPNDTGIDNAAWENMTASISDGNSTQVYDRDGKLLGSAAGYQQSPFGLPPQDEPGVESVQQIRGGLRGFGPNMTVAVRTPGKPVSAEDAVADRINFLESRSPYIGNAMAAGLIKEAGDNYSTREKALAAADANKLGFAQLAEDKRAHDLANSLGWYNAKTSRSASEVRTEAKKNPRDYIEEIRQKAIAKYIGDGDDIEKAVEKANALADVNDPTKQMIPGEPERKPWFGRNTPAKPARFVSKPPGEGWTYLAEKGGFARPGKNRGEVEFVPARALGGPVEEDEEYMVGEKGPEVLNQNGLRSVVGQTGPEIIKPKVPGVIEPNPAIPKPGAGLNANGTTDWHKVMAGAVGGGLTGLRRVAIEQRRKSLLGDFA